MCWTGEKGTCGYCRDNKKCEVCLKIEADMITKHEATEVILVNPRHIEIV